MNGMRVVAMGLAITAALTASASSASAGTIGSLATVGTALPCISQLVTVNTSSGPGDPVYAFPAGGGHISSWSMATPAPATAGAAVALVVLRRGPFESFTFVAVDNQRLPTPLPPGEIASFVPKAPINARAGDLIGLTAYDDGAVCTIDPAGETAAVLDVGWALDPPTVGGRFTPELSAPGDLVNVAATFDQDQDAGVAGAAVPGTIVAGRIGSYVFTVTNRGAFNGPITVSATLPAGLTVLSALVGTGSCAVAGQTVTCTTARLDAGASVPLSIVVRAAGAGTYAASATASVIGAETAPGDNTAGATLTVTPVPLAAPAAPACKTILLKGMPLALAKRAIVALNCTVGKVTKAASKAVKKGLVVSTSPGAGKSLASGAKVNVVQSSGPPKKNKRKPSTKRSAS